MAKHVAFALVDAVAESVCQERVACKTLGFLNEKAEGEGGGRVERGWSGGGCQAGLGVDDETADEMQIRVDAMLL